jgi:hypothetical protein
MSQRTGAIAALLLLFVGGCATKFHCGQPREISEIVWDDFDGDGHDEPRLATGVAYHWSNEEKQR